MSVMCNLGRAVLNSMCLEQLCCAAQKPILIEDYSNLYNVNGKALTSGGLG